MISSLTDTSMENDHTVEVLTRNKKEIRVTSHGKMKSMVSLSLSFLQENQSDNKQVILHTLPLSIDTVPAASKASESKNGHLHSATATTSRLISIVEIVKREYIKLLQSTSSSRFVGLYQYNEIGTLEALGQHPAIAQQTEVHQPDVQRSTDILRAMGGRNFPRQTQTPYMRVTLSTVELPELIERGATLQPPLVRQSSKSAKRRAKKRAAKANPTNT